MVVLHYVSKLVNKAKLNFGEFSMILSINR